jgi:hypothetical protein
MIEVYIQGRLGNQMFQYAFARALQEKKNGEPINLCFCKFLKEKNSLQDFNVLHFYTNEKGYISLYQKMVISIFRIIRKIENINWKDRLTEQIFEFKYQKTLNFFGIYWVTQGYYKFPIKKTKNTILIGYFESAKYFETIKDQIKNEFIPKHDKIPFNYDLYEKIETTESVCLAVRRGDFVTDEHVKNVALVCTDNYYTKAITTIKKKVNNPVFFIFSNDIKWVQENMNFGNDTKIYYESENNPVWETMRLMYSCKHLNF